MYVGCDIYCRPVVKKIPYKSRRSCKHNTHKTLPLNSVPKKKNPAHILIPNFLIKLRFYLSIYWSPERSLLKKIAAIVSYEFLISPTLPVPYYPP
jgi:hypothetical protein